MLPSMKLIKISEGEILLQNTSDNSTLRKKTDAVVLSIGVKQNTSFIEKIEKNFSIVHVLGDANKPGRIAQAIETGFEKAYFLE